MANKGIRSTRQMADDSDFDLHHISWTRIKIQNQKNRILFQKTALSIASIQADGGGQKAADQTLSLKQERQPACFSMATARQTAMDRTDLFSIPVQAHSTLKSCGLVFKALSSRFCNNYSFAHYAFGTTLLSSCCLLDTLLVKVLCYMQRILSVEKHVIICVDVAAMQEDWLGIETLQFSLSLRFKYLFEARWISKCDI